MSFLTELLETIPHFGYAIEQTEQKLKSNETKDAKRLRLLVQLSYCYAHVQLQKGVAAADEAIVLAETLNDQCMKAYALCAKAMNEFRIGYIVRAQTAARQALAIFESINDQEGRCDAYFHLGAMPYISEGPGDTALHLQKACEEYAASGNTTGVYLVRIQQTLQLFLATKFEEGTREIKALIEELSAPPQRHLLCFAHMQLTLSMHLRQDVVQFLNCILAWQKVAEANGNFHDYTMTKAILPDAYRLQHIDVDVMQACLESIECAEKLGSIHGHSTVSIVMAHILSGHGQYADALLYFQKAMDAAHKIEDGYKYLMALNATGETYLKLGQMTEARQSFETAKNEAARTKDRLNLIAAQRHLAELAYQQGQFDRALSDFKILLETADTSEGWNIQDYGSYASCIAKASDAALMEAGLTPGERNTLRHQYIKKHLGLAQQQQNKREQANASNSLAEYYEEINDLHKAIQYRKIYIQLYEELVNEQSMKSMADLRLQYESEKKEKEIVLLKKESEQTLLNERLRIGRDLHDEIGSTLGSIAIYSDVAKNRSIKNENPEEVLSKIGDASRELIEKMSDIVWSLNPDNEPFSQLQNRMQAFAAMTLTPRNITVEFKTDDELKTLQLTGEQRKNIFLIYKESVYNVVKYADCKNVLIALSKSNNNFTLIIKDDGKGFDMDNVVAYNGNGIRNMKARAKDIKASLLVNSKRNEGSSIELRLDT